MKRLAGTGTLLRLAARRDRLMVPGYVLVFTAVAWFSAAASSDLYRSTAAVRQLSDGWNTTTALVAMHGRIYDPSSLPAAALVKLTGMGTAMVGLLALLLVIRHTRADEEVGRTELASGGVVGGWAHLTAAVLLASGAVLATGLLSGVAVALAGLPWQGSLAFAAAWAGAGLVFAAVGAVAAQLATSARAARGVAVTVLVGAYIVRAIGDTQPADGARWISWLSPVGWAQQVRPYAGNRWWALVPAAVAVVAVLAVAVVLLSRRDLGAGLIRERPGPATGPDTVSPLRLAWRLERAALLGWSVGLVVVGLVLGSIASTIQSLLEGSRFQEYLALLGGVSRMEDAFLSAELGIVAVAVAGFGISAAQRMRSDEAQGRAEALLAVGVSRTSYTLGHLAVAVVGTGLLLLATGAAVGTSHALATGDPAQLWRVTEAALVRLPAVWVMTALVPFFFGLAGRATPLAWVALVAVLVVGEFGPVMDLPSWMLDLSPFSYVPDLPGGTLQAAPLLGLSLVAVGLAAAGLVGFRRRDLRTD